MLTSALTLLEVPLVPYRAGNRQLAEQYEALLQLRAAAQLRAASGAKMPDALQLVAALGAVERAAKLIARTVKTTGMVGRSLAQ